MKDLKISKELLGSVMEFKKQNVYSNDLDFIRLNENNIQFAFKTEHNVQSVFSINIYEFAFKCKEWVNKQDYDNNCFVTILYEDGTSKTIITKDGFGLNGNTEVEAIIKTCDYILEQKVNK